MDRESDPAVIPLKVPIVMFGNLLGVRSERTIGHIEAWVVQHARMINGFRDIVKECGDVSLELKVMAEKLLGEHASLKQLGTSFEDEACMMVLLCLSFLFNLVVRNGQEPLAKLTVRLCAHPYVALP